MTENVQLPNWSPEDVPNESVAPQGYYQVTFKSFETKRTNPEKGPERLMIAAVFMGTPTPAENGVMRGKTLRNWYVIANPEAPDVIDNQCMGTINIKKLIKACNVVPTHNLQKDLESCLGSQIIVYTRVDENEKYGKQNTMSDIVFSLNDSKCPPVGPDNKSLVNASTQVGGVVSDTKSAPPPGFVGNDSDTAVVEKSPQTDNECFPGTSISKLDENGEPNTKALQEFAAQLATSTG